MNAAVIVRPLPKRLQIAPTFRVPTAGGSAAAGAAAGMLIGVLLTSGSGATMVSAAAGAVVSACAGAGAADHQMGVLQAAGHVAEEGGDLGLHQGVGIDLSGLVHVLGAGLLLQGL